MGAGLIISYGCIIAFSWFVVLWKIYHGVTKSKTWFEKVSPVHGLNFKESRMVLACTLLVSFHIIKLTCFMSKSQVFLFTIWPSRANRQTWISKQFVSDLKTYTLQIVKRSSVLFTDWISIFCFFKYLSVGQKTH